MHFIATFYPNARGNWSPINDPLPGPNQWDVCAYLQTCAPEQRDAIVSAQGHAADVLKSDPAAPQWIREWDGPWHICVEQLGQFFPALRRSLDRNGPTFYDVTVRIEVNPKETDLCAQFHASAMVAFFDRDIGRVVKVTHQPAALGADAPAAPPVAAGCRR